MKNKMNTFQIFRETSSEFNYMVRDISFLIDIINPEQCSVIK